jgi:hypothetical protein
MTNTGGNLVEEIGGTTMAGCLHFSTAVCMLRVNYHTAPAKAVDPPGRVTAMMSRGCKPGRSAFGLVNQAAMGMVIFGESQLIQGGHRLDFAQWVNASMSSSMISGLANVKDANTQC